MRDHVRCGSPLGGGRTCKRRDCPRCGVAWAKSWEAVTSGNLAAYNGPVALVSITAPGADVLPWSCAKPHRHGGPKGCRVKADAADVWSELAPGNWRKLRDAARVATVRATGTAPTLLERVWEPQKRGVPHLHVVLGLATPAEHEAARVFVDELHRLAPEHRFGFVDRKLKPIAAGEAARYLSGYLLGRSRRKGTVRENIADPRMPRSLIWLTPALTSTSTSPRVHRMRERIGVERGTGLTIRVLRYARWYFAALAGRVNVYPRLFGQKLVDVAQVAARLERGHGPPEDDEDRLRRHMRNLRLMRQLQPAYAFGW